MLKDIVVSKKTIKVDGDQSFEVRGLTLTDLGNLIKEHEEPLGKLMEGDIDMNEMAGIYPEFMAKVVALSAEEPDAFENVKNLPFTTQLLAFEACWDMTIPDYQALEKLLERIKGIIPKFQGKKEQDTKPKSKQKQKQ